MASSPIQKADSGLRIAPNGVQWLPVRAWEQEGWLWHGFSTRKGGLTRAYCETDAPGELNLGFTAADIREVVLQNRRLLAEAITGDLDTPLVTVRQIHSAVVVLAGDDSSSGICEGDGLTTDKSGLLLGIQTADCIPVLVADRKRHVVAGFHAGWRGTVQRIVENGVSRMRTEFGSEPEDLIAGIGPGIGSCCYAVGEELRSSFVAEFAYAGELFREVTNGHAATVSNLHLDLTEANRRQLLDAGLKPDSIQVVGGCTSCQPELFFSHRASGGNAGRMLSVIGIRPR